MTDAARSSAHRAILRATAIVGGASAMNILIGLARNKIAALLLGPAGVGTIGLLLNLVTTIASLVGLGIAMSGVRALASAGDEAARGQAQRTITRLTAGLAVAGTLVTVLFRGPIAAQVLGDRALGWQVAWLAPAVAFTLWSSTQIALLNGWRRLGDLARAQVGGAALGTTLGIAALVLWGEAGILAYVVAAPLGMVAVGTIYTARLPRPDAQTDAPDRSAVTPAAVPEGAGALIRLGVPMMLGGLAMPLALLAIRAVIGDQLGADALGQFTAAWTLSATYVGFVLAAMGTDYFPRLSATIADHRVSCRMVNDQAEVALLLAMPVLLGVQATAPWLIRLLYSDAFVPAVTILHWQIAGDVLKLASWPLAFVILAQGRGKLFWIIEALVMSVMTGAVWLLVAPLGLEATGIAYALAYLVYLPILLIAARRMIGLRIEPRIAAIVALGLAGVGGIALVHRWSDVAALALGLVLAALSGINTLLYLKTLGRRPPATGLQPS